ncbi:phosphopentomutase [Maribacter sp. 2304DJ31-5]|uniref:phosphopentomutase n=1 Tax=Maribacter sp. 2304DJ31-5 TaxID=3386273 RepID=UPI0039BD2072
MKVILMVMDSVGIGALPDAHLYNDLGSNTVGNIAKTVPGFQLPNLVKLGLGNISPSLNIASSKNPIGSYGRALEKSIGKDTTTGHWEICGIVLEKAFPTFPNGFPSKIIRTFEKTIKRNIVGNIVGSGTDIINRYGEVHIETGFPIVYTSADSVFQIAMHEKVISLEEQYKICKIARELLRDDFEVGRVIARPFIGVPGNFARTANRRDFSIKPPSATLLDVLKNNKKEVVAIGKINDIFSGSGITNTIKTINNNHGVKETISCIKEDFEGLIFTNLIDFDMHYGHRRNVEGYANCLMDFDAQIPSILNSLGDDDVLIITADHGNDPTASGTDHTREYIPILCYGKQLMEGVSIGTRTSFSDIGATILDAFKIRSELNGVSFWQIINDTAIQK